MCGLDQWDCCLICYRLPITELLDLTAGCIHHRAHVTALNSGLTGYLWLRTHHQPHFKVVPYRAREHWFITPRRLATTREFSTVVL